MPATVTWKDGTEEVFDRCLRLHEKHRNGKWTVRYAAKRGQEPVKLFKEKEALGVMVELPWKDPRSPNPFPPRRLA